MHEVSEGDHVQVVGSHYYKGRSGVVVQVEDVEGAKYAHISINGTRDSLLLRPGQYKVINKGQEHPSDVGERLSAEVLPHIHRVVNNHRFSKVVRAQFLMHLSNEIRILATQLSKENDES